MFNEKRPHCCIYFIIGVFCALNSICRLKWNKRAPPFPGLLYYIFFFVESNNSPGFFNNITMHSDTWNKSRIEVPLCKWRRKPVGKQKPCNEHEQFTNWAIMFISMLENCWNSTHNTRQTLYQFDMRQAESRCVFFWHS